MTPLAWAVVCQWLWFVVVVVVVMVVGGCVSAQILERGERREEYPRAGRQGSTRLLFIPLPPPPSIFHPSPLTDITTAHCPGFPWLPTPPWSDEDLYRKQIFAELKAVQVSMMSQVRGDHALPPLNTQQTVLWRKLRRISNK